LVLIVYFKSNSIFIRLKENPAGKTPHKKEDGI